MTPLPGGSASLEEGLQNAAAAVGAAGTADDEAGVDGRGVIGGVGRLSSSQSSTDETVMLEAAVWDRRREELEREKDEMAVGAVQGRS